MVTDDWRRERSSVSSSFDAVADLYREEFADELSRKPSDRTLLDSVASRFPTAAGTIPVLEVGAGPGQVAAYLTQRGVPVVVSDLSLIHI